MVGGESYIIMSVIGLVSVVGAFAAARASGAKDVTEAAVSLLAPLRERMAQLEYRLEVLEIENRILRAWGEHAFEVAVQFGGDPLPFPVFSENFVEYRSNAWGEQI